MAEIHHLTVVPGENYKAECDALLEAAKGRLRSAVIIGWDNDDNLYFRQTDSEGETNLLLDIAKHTLIGSFTDETE